MKDGWLHRFLSEQRCLERCLGLPAKVIPEGTMDRTVEGTMEGAMEGTVEGTVEGAPREGEFFGGRGDVAMGRAALPSPACAREGSGDGRGE